MIPSHRVYLLLLLGTVLAVVIATLGSTFTNPGFLTWAIVGTLGWNGIVLAAMVMDGIQVKSHRVTVTRDLLQRLLIGRENPVTLRVSSGNRRAIVQIRDSYPTSFYVSDSVHSLTLPAHHSKTVTYMAVPFRRGEYHWNQIYVRQLGAWGLAWDDWQIPQKQTVLVYPDLMGLRSLSIRLTLQNSGNIRRARRQGMGTEFTELRDYAAGDDPRLIDWKATARRDRVLVKVLEPEQEQTLIILLDRGRLMTAQVKGLTRFDWGLNAALSLALAGLHRGDRVGIGVFDRQMHTWLPPQRGQTYLTNLINQLTLIQPDLLESDYLGAVSAIATHQTRRALVVFITEVIDEIASTELLTAISRLSPRHLPFCVTLRDPEIDLNAHTPTTTVSETYARAVALDLLSQRQLAFAKLKQKGVLILDAPANQVSDDLVNRYLQLKVHNQL